MCRYKGKFLTDLFDTRAEAVAWHIQFCQCITAGVLQRRDGMETRPLRRDGARRAVSSKSWCRGTSAWPARRASLCLLKRCGRARAAWTSTRSPSRPSKIVQYDRVVEFLQAWKKECCGRQRLSPALIDLGAALP